MTNTQLKKEILILLLAMLLAYVLAMLIIPYNNIYVSDIYLSASERQNNILNKLTSPAIILLALLLLFPLLFIINSIRSILLKFSNRSLTIYLLFTSFLSIISTLVLLASYKIIMPILGGSWTIYPPLSAMSEYTEPPYTKSITLITIIFICMQLIIFTICFLKSFDEKKSGKI